MKINVLSREAVLRVPYRLPCETKQECSDKEKSQEISVVAYQEMIFFDLQEELQWTKLGWSLCTPLFRASSN